MNTKSQRAPEQDNGTQDQRDAAEVGAGLQPDGNAAAQLDLLDNPTQPAQCTVVGGDTLWGIARRWLDDGSRYPEIVALNTEKDLEPLQIGTILRLPAIDGPTSGDIDVTENLENHPAGSALSMEMLMAAVRAIFRGEDIGPALATAAGDELMALSDGDFAAVLNTLQAAGWLDELLAAMAEDDREALTDRADVLVTIPVTLFDDADPAQVTADFAFANECFNPHGIAVEEGNRVEVSAADTTAALGADHRLDDAEGAADTSGRRSVSAEVTRMLAINQNAGFLTGYWVKDFEQVFAPGTRGWALDDSAFQIMNEGVVVSTDTAAEDTFAHELGHILTERGHTDIDGTALHDDNLMQSGGSRNVGVGDLTDDQVAEIKTSVYARFRG
jgi:hypothetical protein